MSQASLLTIPKELREIIVELVLTSDAADAPNLSNPDLLTQHRSELQEDRRAINVSAWTGVRDILFEPFKPQLHAIFLVNRQLSLDAAVVLARIKVNYHLDVILLNEVSLLPTWLLIPKPASRVETLTCTFRIAGLGTSVHQGYSGFLCGDGAGPALAWVIYGLLELFLLRGPDFRHVHDSLSYSDQGHSYSIDTLVINVETPPGIDPSRFGPPLSGRRRRRGESETQTDVLDPKYLEEFIQREIRSLLYMGYHTAEYGDILYENIGRIVINLDGEPHFDQDLWEILKNRSPTYDGATTSRHQRVQGFQDWKPRAIAKRSRLGLNVAGAEVDKNLEHKSYKDCYLTAERLLRETGRQ